MSVFDSMKDKASELKDKATGLVDQNADKVDEGIDKGTDFADEKTGGKYTERIEGGADQARDQLDALDGKDDDLGTSAQTPPAAPPA